MKKALGIGSILAASALVVAGCSAADGGTETGEPTEVVYQAGDGTCAGEPREGVDFATANDFIVEFQQPVAELLQTEPLPQPVTSDTVVAFLNNGTPIAGIMAEHMEKAATAAGVTLRSIDTGSDAQSINTALNSVVELAPDILISIAIDATFFQDQLAQLEAGGTSIVYASQINAEDFGLEDTLGGRNANLINGDVLASGAIAFTCGTASEFVFYNIPELAFSSVLLEATQARLDELCDDCTLRVVDISIADPSPADKIVSDLQTNPQTQFFVTGSDSFQIGLTEKAQLAGLTNAVGFGQGSLPPNVQQVADGTQMAGQVVDFNIFMWLALDEGLRKAQGVWEPYTDWDAASRATSLVITQSNAADYLDGFSAYPGMEDEFLAMWGK